jgi:hypothetical protein
LVIPDLEHHQNLVAVGQEEQLQALETMEQGLGLVVVERLHRLQPALPVAQDQQESLLFTNTHKKMEKRKPSCEVEGLVGNAETIMQEPKLKEVPKSHDQKEAEKLGVTLAKYQAMQQYAAQLVKQDRRIKPSTVRMKVAKKFNLKLV